MLYVAFVYEVRFDGYKKGYKCIIILNQKIVSNLVRNFVPEKSHKSIMLR